MVSDIPEIPERWRLSPKLGKVVVSNIEDDDVGGNPIVELSKFGGAEKDLFSGSTTESDTATAWVEPWLGPAVDHVADVGALPDVVIRMILVPDGSWCGAIN